MTYRKQETILEAAERWQREVGIVHDIALADPRANNIMGFLPVSPAFTAQVMLATGIDVAGFSHVIDTSAIRHIYSHHGQPTEAQRGQIPIVKTDFLCLLQVVLNPDAVIDGGSDRMGQTVVRVQKMVNGFLLEYRVSIRSGKKRIAAVTLFKKP